VEEAAAGLALPGRCAAPRRELALASGSTSLLRAGKELHPPDHHRDGPSDKEIPIWRLTASHRKNTRMYMYSNYKAPGTDRHPEEEPLRPHQRPGFALCTPLSAIWVSAAGDNSNHSKAFHLKDGKICFWNFPVSSCPVFPRISAWNLWSPNSKASVTKETLNRNNE